MSKVRTMKSKSLPADVKRSLKTLINYLAEQEEEHFVAYLDELGIHYSTQFNTEEIKKFGPEAKNHIYYHICLVSEWFNKD